MVGVISMPAKPCPQAAILWQQRIAAEGCTSELVAQVSAQERQQVRMTNKLSNCCTSCWDELSYSVLHTGPTATTTKLEATYKPVEAGRLLRTEQLKDHIAFLSQLLDKLVHVWNHRSTVWSWRQNECRPAVTLVRPSVCDH